MVDDHQIVRDGFVGIFSIEPGLEIAGQASSGPEGVVVVEQVQPDIVLMDLRMPGGDGVEAISTLVERRTQARIIVVTTYDTDHDILAALGTEHRDIC